LTRLARPGALLLNCPGGDLLGSLLGSALSFLAALDVFVLTRTLRALLDAAWGHCGTSSSRFENHGSRSSLQETRPRSKSVPEGGNTPTPKHEAVLG